MANHDNALKLVFERNAFYRQLHFLVLGAFFLSLCVIGLLIYTIFYLKKNPPHPYYFAADNVSRLLQIIPVNTPNMSTEDVIKWTSKAVIASFSYDYINYHAQLQSAQKYFTPYGWSRYMAALQSSNNMIGLIQRRLVASAQIVEPPKIVAQGILGGAYAWKFEMPILVQYMPADTSDNTNKAFSNALIVTVTVQRQKALDGNSGLGIVQLLAKQATLPASGPQEISNTP